MQLRWTEEAANDLEHIANYLVLSPPPYLVVYQISGGIIHIVRILHGAQRWP